MKVECITPKNTSLLIQARQKVNPDEGKTQEEFAAEAEKYAIAGDRKAFVMLGNSGVIGYILVLAIGAVPEAIPDGKHFSSYAHISKIGVDQAFRRKGVGKILLVHAEAWAKARSMKGIWLDYLPETEGLAEFYSNAEYRKILDFEDAKKGKVKLRRIAAKGFKTE
ncbi:MAG: Acetyltransferase family [Candidatus Taylorbacteria bacterium]|nr:Acetyltransferase family [Candidatus Taylorbacteria bacterium]